MERSFLENDEKRSDESAFFLVIILSFGNKWRTLRCKPIQIKYMNRLIYHPDMKKCALRLFLMVLFVGYALTAQAFERETIWPKGKMPDAQPGQIAAMTSESGAPGFKPDKHRMPYLEIFT